MRKYDHLFFDLDNTLWDFDSNSKLALLETLISFNINNGSVPFDDFYHYYKTVNESLWDAYRKKEITKADLVKTRFEKTLQNFEIENIEPLAMNDRYLMLMPNQTQLFEGVIETLDYLKNRGYQMHIITNGFKEVQHQKLNSSGLRKYFNWVFISEEIQAPKPNKLIFQHALKNCNAKKSKSIMIGDSWDVDILGAKNFGIDQAFFSNDNNHNYPVYLIKTKLTENTSIVNLSPQSKTFFVINFKSFTEIL